MARGFRRFFLAGSLSPSPLALCLLGGACGVGGSAIGPAAAPALLLLLLVLSLLSVLPLLLLLLLLLPLLTLVLVLPFRLSGWLASLCVPCWSVALLASPCVWLSVSLLLPVALERR